MKKKNNNNKALILTIVLVVVLLLFSLGVMSFWMWYFEDNTPYDKDYRIDYYYYNKALKKN